jgi:hypothetical protein
MVIHRLGRTVNRDASHVPAGAATGSLRAAAALGVVLAQVLFSTGCGGGPAVQGGSELRGSGDLLDTSDAESFGRLAQHLDGRVGLTVGEVGSPDSQRLGTITTAKAWSTIKLVIVAKVLDDAGGPGGLGAGTLRSIRLAITKSDNPAAARLFNGLKRRYGGTAGAAHAVDRVLRAAGDRKTKVSTHGRGGFSSYGQTDWALAEQHRLMSMMAGRCISSRGSVSYVLRLMGEVVPRQRWGLGSAGVKSRFKGGWGPGRDGRYLVRQVGILESSARHRVVVTIASIPADGRFASGTAMLDHLAKWAAHHADFKAARARACP